jgi:hypothetical protein
VVTSAAVAVRSHPSVRYASASARARPMADEAIGRPEAALEVCMCAPALGSACLSQRTAESRGLVEAVSSRAWEIAGDR